MNRKDLMYNMMIVLGISWFAGTTILQTMFGISVGTFGHGAWLDRILVPLMGLGLSILTYFMRIAEGW